VQNWFHVPAAETPADLAYSFLPLSPRSVLGNPALRQQIESLIGRRPQPRFAACDRLFWFAAILVWMKAGFDCLIRPRGLQNRRRSHHYKWDSRKTE
jgi:hypothetical protein